MNEAEKYARSKSAQLFEKKLYGGKYWGIDILEKCEYEPYFMIPSMKYQNNLTVNTKSSIERLWDELYEERYHTVPTYELVVSDEYIAEQQRIEKEKSEKRAIKVKKFAKQQRRKAFVRKYNMYKRSQFEFSKLQKEYDKLEKKYLYLANKYQSYELAKNTLNRLKEIYFHDGQTLETITNEEWFKMILPYITEMEKIHKVNRKYYKIIAMDFD